MHLTALHEPFVAKGRQGEFESQRDDEQAFAFRSENRPIVDENRTNASHPLMSEGGDRGMLHHAATQNGWIWVCAADATDGDGKLCRLGRLVCVRGLVASGG
ncbi:hypothetical protein [Novipirellula caenicola]|uniref:Uncharacterized protein n=1 Tax=Novipirellula caenicola TaxID=1536901 RepID=A0ABP9VK39_9BACT